MRFRIFAGLVCALIIAWSVAAQAGDKRPGLLDFEKGHFAAALNKWLPFAKAGEPEFQVLVGDMYRRGLGVNKDLFRALEWHEKAAAQGDADGIYHAAQFHLHGQGGVTKNPAKALLMLQQAADLGHWRAQYGVSRAFAKGELVAQDYVKALMWLEISILSSKGEFGRKVFYRRRGLAKHMTDDEVELGKKLAADWLAKH